MIYMSAHFGQILSLNTFCIVYFFLRIDCLKQPGFSIVVSSTKPSFFLKMFVIKIEKL